MNITLSMANELIHEFVHFVDFLRHESDARLSSQFTDLSAKVRSIAAVTHARPLMFVNSIDFTIADRSLN